MPDEPIRTASHRVIIIGDETDALNGNVMIEFIPIRSFCLGDQAPLHRWRIIEFDFMSQDPLGDQDAGVFPPLLRRFALWCNDLVEIGARRDPEPEAVMFFG